MNPQWLYLLPEGQLEQGAQWPVLYSVAGQASLQRSDLASAGQVLQGAGVRVVLAQELLAWHHSPAVGGRRLARQALGFALEEQLSVPLETVHLAFGECDKEHRRAVQSIDRQVFTHLLALLAAQGIEVLSVQVDADLLPPEAAGAWWIAGRWLLGGGQSPRLALSAADARVLAPELMHVAWHPDSEPDLLRVPAAGAIDLCQGAFRRRRPRGPWVGLMAAVLGVTALWFALEHRHTVERAAQVALYATQRQALVVPAALPPTRLQQLAPLAEGLVASAGLHLEQARWQVREGWRLQVLAVDFAALERLRERQPDLVLDDAGTSAEGIRARLNWPVPDAPRSGAQASFSAARLNAEATQAGVVVEGLQWRQGQASFAAQGEALALFAWLHQLERVGGRFQVLELERAGLQLKVRATLEVGD